MAEQTIIVCDVCGKPASETVTIKSERGNFVKDLCNTHVTEIITGGRRPRPGRRKSMNGGSTTSSAKSQTTTSAPKRRGRPPKNAAKAGATGAKRRGRPRKNPA